MATPETIVATSTPPGQGGVGMVRMSGPQSVRIGRRVFRSRRPLGRRARYVEYGFVLDERGKEIDTGLAWVLKAPRSYTGEDMVEITCHGSNLVMETLVRAAIARGAALASPGEFTRRAFLNGRLDLIQAEAVIDLIQAGGRFGLENAYGQASGRLSRMMEQLKSHIVKGLSLIEVGLDFAEEDIEDIEAIESPIVLAEIDEGQRLALGLVDTFEGSRRRQDGFSVIITGRPNAGKSTLFNALLGEDRAIVTPVPGTTRDLVEGQVSWRGERFRLIDTAGLTESADPIEREGIQRARKSIDAADFVVAVFDASKTWEKEDFAVLEVLRRKVGVAVCNKTDLPRSLVLPPGEPSFFIAVSALAEKGLEELREYIIENLPRVTLAEGMGITRERHRDGLAQVLLHLGSAREMLLSREGAECIAVELQEALRGVGEILGENISEEVLDRIFSEFCIGK